MEKELARKQFDEMTIKYGIKHTFSFDEAWDFVTYKKQQEALQRPVSFIPAEYSKENFKDSVMKLESKMRNAEQSLTGDALNVVNPLKHTFADGCYVREVFNPKGILLVTKIHKIAHPFFLLKGDMSILSEKGETRIRAPYYGITQPGTKRIIYTHEECIFVTVHVTDKTDIYEIEKDIIAKTFDECTNELDNIEEMKICHG